MAAGHHLGVSRLSQDSSHSVGVTTQRKNLGLGAHVPHTACAVPASRHDQVQGRMQRKAVHTRQVAVVVTNNLQTMIKQPQPVMCRSQWVLPAA